MTRHRRAGVPLGLGLLLLLLASACGGGSSPSSPSDPGTPLDPSWTLPPANGRFDYQIGGVYTPLASVAVVDRDWHESPAPAVYNICYVNAFQTQPEEATWWHTNHPELLLTENGAEVTDPNWPGEIVLDTSTATKREAIAAIVGGWMDACKAHGFLAVEPDNLDSWTRSNDLLTQADNVEMAKLLADRAHAAGLAIAQKNTSELLPYRTEIGFDFAIVEECQPWGDCDAFTTAYGARWYEVEYSAKDFQDACQARGGQVSIIYRDRNVVPSGNDQYIYQAC
jgi:hypothetical protein